MKTFVSALALAGMASAHCTIWGISVNDKDQGFGNSQGGYIDTPPNNSPVTDVTSKAMECNVANIKASKSVNVNPGDEVAVQWYHNGPVAGDQIIDGSHKGPISVYMSKAGSSMSWTKIAEDGFDGKTWAVEKLRNGSYNGKKGQHTFKVPNVAPGDYVMRPEIIALHEGNRVGGAQFYMECIHVKVGGSGTTALPAGVAIPGYVTANTPGVLFDIYNPFTSYPIPGAKLWDGAGGATSPAASSPAANPPANDSSSNDSPSTGSPAADSPAAGSPAAGSPAGESPAAGSPADESPAAGSPAGESPAAGSPAGESPAAGSPAGDESASCTEGSDDAEKPAEEAAEPANPPTTPSPSDGATAQKYYQCGGQGYTGPTNCVSGTKCVKQNDWYFQCL